jgi:hypothetical protein
MDAVLRIGCHPTDQAEGLSCRQFAEIANQLVAVGSHCRPPPVGERAPARLPHAPPVFVVGIVRALVVWAKFR